MKYFIFSVLLFGTLYINAQENIEVKMSELAIDSLMQPAFVVEIPQADDKTAIKMWEDQLVPKNLLSTFKKLPSMEKEDKGKWQINGIVIDEICPDTLTVFTRITSLKDRISFAALFKTPAGFIGSNENNQMEQRTSAYLRSYAVQVYKEAVQKELDDLEKELKKMENNYSGYDKDNRKLERKSTEGESALKTMNASVETSTSVLTEEQMKEKQKEIKKEEKALKKYTNQMDRNSDKQKKLSKEIKNQEEEIKATKEKLRNIK